MAQLFSNEYTNRS